MSVETVALEVTVPARRGAANAGDASEAKVRRVKREANMLVE